MNFFRRIVNRLALTAFVFSQFTNQVFAQAPSSAPAVKREASAKAEGPRFAIDSVLRREVSTIRQRSLSQAEITERKLRFPTAAGQNRDLPAEARRGNWVTNTNGQAVWSLALEFAHLIWPTLIV